MHVDHVQPLAKGGKHCLRNLQLLDPIENRRKGARWAEAA
jgi:5-methylcytosine-specific restriction endonuclease McrA